MIEGKAALETVARQTDLRGLVLMGAEGINATVSGTAEAIARCKEAVVAFLGVADFPFKDSVGPKHPFSVFKVKIKDEIVTLGRPGLMPEGPVNNHLSPQEWHEAVQDPDTIVIDTRNDYEVEIGKFKSAIDFKLSEFNEFPERLREAGLNKDKRVLIYCTGGIRCEKAILAMNEQGFNKVHQLDGGILNYFKEYPAKDQPSTYEGECFVFDYRVAVDQRLEPTRQYGLCPHCGQPAKTRVTCTQCGRQETICSKCVQHGETTCSKNCSHHASIGSGSSKPHLQELRKRHRV